MSTCGLGPGVTMPSGLAPGRIGEASTSLLNSAKPDNAVIVSDPEGTDPVPDSGLTTAMSESAGVADCVIFGPGPGVECASTCDCEALAVGRVPGSVAEPRLCCDQLHLEYKRKLVFSSRGFSYVNDQLPT